MGLNEFRQNIAAAIELLSKEQEDGEAILWLNEETLAGRSDAGLETLPSELGFPLGTAVAKFRRIARVVAEADGIAKPEQSREAAAALRTISDILKSLPRT